jgi:hypothetical protein
MKFKIYSRQSQQRQTGGSVLHMIMGAYKKHTTSILKGETAENFHWKLEITQE